MKLVWRHWEVSHLVILSFMLIFPIASDSDITRLATLYWFSVEFGLVFGGNDGTQRKAYGAGLLSSFGELEYSCDPTQSRVETWNPDVACETPYPITTFQPKYFIASSLFEVAQTTRKFCVEGLRRPFYARLDEATQQILTVDRDVRQKGDE